MEKFTDTPYFYNLGDTMKFSPYILKYLSLLGAGLAFWFGRYNIVVYCLYVAIFVSALDWIVYNCVMYNNYKVGFIRFQSDGARTFFGIIFALIFGVGGGFLSAFFAPVLLQAPIVYLGITILRKFIVPIFSSDDSVSYYAHVQPKQTTYTPMEDNNRYRYSQDEDFQQDEALSLKEKYAWMLSNSNTESVEGSNGGGFDRKNCYVGEGKHVTDNGWIVSDFGSKPTGERISTNGMVFKNGQYTGARYSHDDVMGNTRYENGKRTISVNEDGYYTRYDSTGRAVDTGRKTSSGKIRWNSENN